MPTLRKLIGSSRTTLLVPPAQTAIHIVIMIIAKNGAMKTVIGATMITNAVIMTDLRDQGPHNHVAANHKTSSTT